MIPTYSDYVRAFVARKGAEEGHRPGEHHFVATCRKQPFGARRSGTPYVGGCKLGNGGVTWKAPPGVVFGGLRDAITGIDGRYLPAGWDPVGRGKGYVGNFGGNFEGRVALREARGRVAPLPSVDASKGSDDLRALLLAGLIAMK